MARWEGGARERLMAAALELFRDQGYDSTTVAQIAERAGLTERTFYRQFTDKRDVLFSGQEAFEAMFLDGLAAAAGDRADPLELVLAAVGASASFFDDGRRPWARARQRVIDATPALQERERAKLVGVGRALESALVARGVSRHVATLAAETGVVVFTSAFTAWIADDEVRDIVTLQRATLSDLRSLLR